MGLTARRLAAHLVRLAARRRRLLACWLLLVPLVSLALLPADRGQPWLPHRPAAACTQPPPADRPDIDAEQIWTQLQLTEVSARAASSLPPVGSGA